jgi:hypothetical protein
MIAALIMDSPADEARVNPRITGNTMLEALLTMAAPAKPCMRLA